MLAYRTADQKSRQARGVIVVDTGILIDMECKVNSRFMTDPSRMATYLDMLPILAKHGYQIVIPESVAYEAAQVLIDGTNLLDYFYIVDKPKWEHKALVAFLQAAAKGEYPNVSIVATTEPPEITNYLERIKTTAATLKTISDHQSPAYRGVLDYLKGLQRQHKQFDMDKAMESAVDGYMPTASAVPVFVLSTDQEAVTKIAQKHPRIGVLSINGMIKAIQKYGAARLFGIDETVDTRTMSFDMEGQLLKASEGKQRGHHVVLDLRGELYRRNAGFLAQARWDQSLHIVDQLTQDMPFGRTIKQLASDMPKTEPLTSPGAKNLASCSQSEKFRQRYGPSWGQRVEEHNERRGGKSGPR